MLFNFQVLVFQDITFLTDFQCNLAVLRDYALYYFNSLKSIRTCLMMNILRVFGKNVYFAVLDIVY